MEKKIILCKNYDDITWFDGTVLKYLKMTHEHFKLYVHGGSMNLRYDRCSA